MGTRASIGLIVPNISNTHFSIIARVVENICLKAGYMSVVFSTGQDDDRENQILRMMRQQRVAGCDHCAHPIARRAWQAAQGGNPRSDRACLTCRSRGWAMTSSSSTTSRRRASRRRISSASAIAASVPICGLAGASHQPGPPFRLSGSARRRRYPGRSSAAGARRLHRNQAALSK